MLWHGRHLLVSPLRTVRWEADQADEVLGVADVDVGAIVAVHGASVPWGQMQAEGVTVVPARRVPDLLQALPPTLGPERVAWLATSFSSAMPPDSHGYSDKAAGQERTPLTWVSEEAGTAWHECGQGRPCGRRRHDGA
jgi:hypothetical protein